MKTIDYVSFFLIVFCASIVLPSDLLAQPVAPPGFRPVFAGRAIRLVADDPFAVESIFEDSDSEEVSGAALKTDPDLEALLDKANRHAEDGNFRVATRLWQAVLERSGDSLYSEDEVNYYSIADQVEQILAELPDDALDIYRVTADASAKQILTEADDPNDVAALMRVAGNFFISSEGDDAAFRLGSLYLDRHDFSGALRMFRKIATQHPDPSVPMDEVYARMAICHAFMGNAELALDSLSTGRGYGADSEAIDTVERSLSSLSPTDTRDAVLDRWFTSHGNSRRMAAMPSLPESAFTVDQVAAWQFFVPPKDDRFVSRPETEGKILVGERSSGNYAAETRSQTEKKMIREWSKNGWRPAGHLLFDENHVIFKAPADVVAFDRSKVSEFLASEQTGKDEKSDDKKDAGPGVADFAAWRSIWRNVFEVDPATLRLNQLSGMRQRITVRRSGRSRQTNSSAKLALFPKTMHFDDLIYHQMSKFDGVVYAVEGKSFHEHNKHGPTRIDGRGWNVIMRRTRSNFLTAYESETGRMLWRLPRVNKPESPSYDPSIRADDPDADRWLRSGGFMAAPVKFANLLILPVNQNGAIHLYAIDPEKEGETVWSAFLCDEPETGSVASSPINLTIDGSDLFATCGTGVLFVLDPTTGKIRYAKRYARSGQTNEMLRRSYNSTITSFDGWSSDVILPNGRELICLCSDTDSIVAIDRNDGSLIWKTGLRPYGVKVDYIIGSWGDLLYLGGQQTIIAIDLKAEGYVAWGGEPLFDGAVSTGRGMVTPQGVFVPVGNAIWRFGLEAKKGRADLLNQVEAFLGTEAPVGNLYSDGDRIWVHGASRLYALAPKEE